jgi:hypothetical protein
VRTLGAFQQGSIDHVEQAFKYLEPLAHKPGESISAPLGRMQQPVQQALPLKYK